MKKLINKEIEDSYNEDSYGIDGQLKGAYKTVGIIMIIVTLLSVVMLIGLAWVAIGLLINIF